MGGWGGYLSCQHPARGVVSASSDCRLLGWLSSRQFLYPLMMRQSGLILCKRPGEEATAASRCHAPQKPGFPGVVLDPWRTVCRWFFACLFVFSAGAEWFLVGSKASDYRSKDVPMAKALNRKHPSPRPVPRDGRLWRDIR